MFDTKKIWKVRMERKYDILFTRWRKYLAYWKPLFYSGYFFSYYIDDNAITLNLPIYDHFLINQLNHCQPWSGLLFSLYEFNNFRADYRSKYWEYFFMYPFIYSYKDVSSQTQMFSKNLHIFKRDVILFFE